MGRLLDSPFMLLIILFVLAVIAAIVVLVVLLVKQSAQPRNQHPQYGPPGV